MSRVFAIVMSSLVLAFISFQAAQGQETRSITVSGNAEILVVPDEVVLTLGIETVDAVLASAKLQSDAAMTSFLELASNAGIPNKKVATEHLFIRPKYEVQRGRSNQSGYIVRRTVALTLEDISLFEDLLTSALEAGVNQVHTVEFRTSKLREHRDEARGQALNAAREKAEAMAATLGQKIGRPLKIGEGASSTWSPYNFLGGSGHAMQNVVTAAPNAGPEWAGPTPPGQVSVSAQVSVTFELVD